MNQTPKKVTVIIPSRAQSDQIPFLTRAIASVRAQEVDTPVELTFLIAVDKGCGLSHEVLARLGAECVEAEGRSQAAALNAGVAKVLEGPGGPGRFVAFLEDDDQWEPSFLKMALVLADHFDFVSSTQAEYDENDTFLRVNDFATPSGWFMPVSTLLAVGLFNEDYRYHLDNEWLGRLIQNKLRRGHLIESTAPKEFALCVDVRPWLAKVLALSKGGGLCRHGHPYPLVRRLVHSGSGVARIASDPEARAQSEAEQAGLEKAFGLVPW